MDGVPRIRNLAEGREARRSGLLTPTQTPTPFIASIDLGDVEMKDIDLEGDRSDDLETAVRFKARLTYWFRQMMFVSGETAEASAETTWMIEEIVREQVIEMVCELHVYQTLLMQSASTSNSPCQPTWLQIHLYRRLDLPNPTQHRQSLPSEDIPVLEGRAQECQRFRRQRWRRCRRS